MSKPSLADKDFLTVIETAEYFGLSRRKLFRLAEEKNLPFMAMYGKQFVECCDQHFKWRWMTISSLRILSHFSWQEL